MLQSEYKVEPQFKSAPTGAEPRIFIEHLNEGYERVIERGFTFLGCSSRIDSSTAVCIKPNLTFPVFRRGVMTSPEAVEALIAYLKNFTDRITICEADSGGYNKFSMDEVFARTGILAMAKRFGVRVVNMSHVPSRSIAVRHGFRKLTVPLPAFLLEETDLFVTMPVPKVHCNTVVSLSLKNQWGVIQEPSRRLTLHPYFKDVIYGITKALPPSFVAMDGKYGLTTSGPMRGDAVELNWMLLSNSLFHADYFVASLMGFKVPEISYLRNAMEKEGIASLDGVQFNDAPQVAFQPFGLKRSWTDLPGLLAFNSRTLAYLGYESVLARPLHRLLYMFREPFY